WDPAPRAWSTHRAIRIRWDGRRKGNGPNGTARRSRAPGTRTQAPSTAPRSRPPGLRSSGRSPCRPPSRRFVLHLLLTERSFAKRGLRVPWAGSLRMSQMEAAFFDLDKTVISKSSSLALTRPMYRAGLVSRSGLLKGAYAQLVYLMVGADEKRMGRVKESMAALTKGWERSQVEEIIREALTDLIDPYIYLEALD